MAATDEDVSWEIAYEHERKQPVVGWGSTYPGHMLPTDRKGWTDHRGQPVAFHPPLDPTQPSPHAGDWLGGWAVDNSTFPCDKDGWTYAADMHFLETRPNQHESAVDFVRRRRWVRRRRAHSDAYDCPPTPAAALAPSTDGQEFPRGDHEKGVHCWSAPVGNEFKVRGANYLSDKVKVKSQPALMELVHVDLISTDGKADLVAERPECFIKRQRALGDQRFMLCVNFQVPPHHAIIYFAMPHDAHTKFDAPFRTVWERFLMGDDAFRNSRWKVIPSVVEGPWVVKKSVGQKPALLGNKLAHTYHKTANYIEMDCDINSSTAAAWLVGLLKGYATAFAIDIAFCVQGNQPDELPERVLAAIRMSRPDLSKARPTDWGTPGTGAPPPGVSAHGQKE